LLKKSEVKLVTNIISCKNFFLRIDSHKGKTNSRENVLPINEEEKNCEGHIQLIVKEFLLKTITIIEILKNHFYPAFKIF